MAHSFERTNSGQDWCQNLGVIEDQEDQDGAAGVTAIKALPLTQVAFLYQRSRHAFKIKCYH